DTIQYLTSMSSIYGHDRARQSVPTRRSSDLKPRQNERRGHGGHERSARRLEPRDMVEVEGAGGERDHDEDRRGEDRDAGAPREREAQEPDGDHEGDAPQEHAPDHDPAERDETGDLRGDLVRGGPAHPRE